MEKAKSTANSSEYLHTTQHPKVSSSSHQHPNSASTNDKNETISLNKPFDICDRSECKNEDSVIHTIHVTPTVQVAQTNNIGNNGRFIPLECVQEDNILEDTEVHEEVQADVLETPQVKFIDGKTGKVSDETVEVTSWSKVVEKKVINPSPPTSQNSPSAVKGGNPAVANNKYNFRKNQEPKFLCSASFCSKLNLPGMKSMVIHNSTSSTKGNLWLFWNTSLATPQVVSISSQMITVSIGDVLVYGVHAHVKKSQTKFLWSEMEIISQFQKPWIVLGDFNAITSPDEKVGGKTPNINSMLDFIHCLNACNLLPAPKTGQQYSWSNCQQGKKRILCILDRVVFNSLWLQKYGDWGYKVGLRIVSDQAPFLGGCASIPKPKNVPWRFQKMWIDHPSFLSQLKKVWSEHIIGDPAFIFMQKLKN
ncbi:uncharacterized protein LOC113360575 [Papaver somniferum]|uniref:uncharacterized protein LOC113360575 n=1 Tax=Papaver somniferum TaxID=3469 RepID=UPI000E6FEC9A|nr:uncharacterized protein LOC113360575 [Papaver somniferum]